MARLRVHAFAISIDGYGAGHPPYHVPVFVLTHHPRATLRMAGNTEFHFVTGGIHDALKQATAAAGQQDIRLGGGEHLLAGIDLPALGFTRTEHVPTAHVVLARRK